MKTLLLSICLAFLTCPAKKTASPEPIVDPAMIPPPADPFAGGKQTIDSLFQVYKDSSKLDLFDYDKDFELYIGNLFVPSEKQAILRYKDNDTIFHVLVLQQKSARWDTVFNQILQLATTIPQKKLISLEDFDGDKIPDLKIINNYWDMHTGENSDLWLYKNGVFQKVEGFDEIVSAEYDPDNHQIISYQSAGCADMAMYFAEYQLDGLKVRKLKEIQCDCCDEKHCDIQINEEKPFRVKAKQAHKYVPALYREAVQSKLQQ